MKLNDLQVSVINNFLNLLILEIANNYLNNLKNFKSKAVDEIVLQFLDNSIFLAQEEIDITNDFLKSKIKKLTTKEKIQFQKALIKKTSYSNLCQMLNYIYTVIKEEDQQDFLFKKIYHWYDENETVIIDKQEVDIYKEIKPWLLNSNNNIYNGKINRT